MWDRRAQSDFEKPGQSVRELRNLTLEEELLDCRTVALYDAVGSWPLVFSWLWSPEKESHGCTAGCALALEFRKKKPWKTSECVAGRAASSKLPEA